MTTLTKDDFTKALAKALNHQPRFYSKIDGLSFRYKSDESSLEAKYKNFQDILKALGSTKSPDLFQIKQGRSLLLVHYSGHSWLGEKNGLMLGPETAKSICWSLFVWEVTDPLFLEGNGPIDALVILDSYYSCLATRAKPAERIVEVAAAVKANDTASGEDTGQHESFSSRLANYLARCKEHGSISIDFAAAIAAISAESPSRKPTHEIVFGDTSIGVQLGSLPQDRTASSPSKVVIQRYAVVQVHLVDAFNDKNCQKLSKWTRQLDPDHPITVEKAYETDNSMLLILMMPYNVFLRTGLGERYLIGLVQGCVVDRSKC